MTRKIHELSGGSHLVGKLPKGCQLCAEGKKMVLFITGLCDSSCYYCPLSESKAGKDVVFADEVPVREESDILDEVIAIGGEGAGISGGDPLQVLDRTLHYISLLKHHFGQDFHIHLYTSKSDISEETISSLIKSGLDEIRFHPQGMNLSGLEHAVQLGLNAGIEIPVIPDHDEQIRRIILKAKELGVSFVNLNELEASETNFERLSGLGMKLVGMHSASIDGSFQTAMRILQWAATELDSISVHYCSARYKDAVQMRNRLERRLERVIRPFEMQDEEDTLIVLGVIRAKHGTSLSMDDLNSLVKMLEELEVPADLFNLDVVRMRIEIASWVLEDIADEIRQSSVPINNLEMGIAYEYPSYDRLQTLFEPL